MLSYCQRARTALVRFLLQVLGVRQRHDRQLLFPLLVIGMVAAVLTHGALGVRPAAGTDGDTGGDVAQAVVAEAPDPPRPAGTRPALRGDPEKTLLTYFSDYWAQLLSHAGVHLIAVGSEMHAGVVVEPGVAVVTAAAAAEPSATAERVHLSREMAGAGGERNAAGGLSGKDTEAPESTGAAAALTDESADPTDGVLAVDRMSGLALVAAPPEVAPFETGSAPGPEVVELLQAGGLLIESVETEAFASGPRLRPGDVLIAWNGEPVDSVEDFEARYDLAVVGERVSYRVLRGRRRVSGWTFMPDAACRPVSPLGIVRLAGLGVVLAWDETAGDNGGAWTMTTLVPDGPAGAAGIEEGDVLLAVVPPAS